jgi:two-component system, OmpR family, sensor histidine kinase KdpD
MNVASPLERDLPAGVEGVLADMISRAAKEPWTWRIPAPVAALLGIVTIVTLTPIALFIFGRQDVANVAILYLFAIALVSVRFGYRPSILAAVASAICFDYFFLAPYHSLAINHIRQLVTFGGMFGTAIFISALNERLRKQARAARHSERRIEHQYTLVKALADAQSIDALCTSAARQIELASNTTASVLLRGSDDKFRRAYRAGGESGLEVEDLPAAEWAAAHLEVAGLGTRSFPRATATYLPLGAARGCVGVVALRPRAGGSLRPSSLIVSMTRQIAMAIERALLADETRTAQLDAETERIRSAVLSSVSHDLRAPLAVIASASSTLVEHGDRLPGSGRAEMARIIHDEARRLNELLKSLLDITRLQSGSLHVNRDWESLEEVIGSVLGRSENRAGRHLLTSIPSDLPLLHVDAILIEQVLLNLVDNAIKHAASDHPIEIEVAARGSDSVVVSVIDHGAGIHPTEMTRIFDKFYRGGPPSGGGLGLGLTIARGIVGAHGGRMWANPTAGGGLTIQFTLPLNAGAPGPVMGSEPIEEGLAS